MKQNYVSDLQKSMFRRAFCTAAFTEFTQIIALTIDTIIICACLGEKEIGAVGLACPFLYLVGIPAACLGNGLQTICTQELGRGQIEKVNHSFSETVVFTILVMTVATLIVFPLIPHLAFLFGARENAADLHGLTVLYMKGLALEILPFVLLSVLAPVVILSNGNRTAMISSVAGGVSNIALDLIAIRLDWGIYGIGLASSLSVIVSLAILMTHFAKKDRIIRFRPVKPVLKDLGKIITTGQPDTVHSAAGMLRSLVLNALAVHVGGSFAVAVLSIHSTLTDFVEIIPSGISGAVSIITGIAYGEKNGEEIRNAGILAHRYILHLSIFALVVLLVFMRPIAQFFLEPDSEGVPLLQFAIGCIAVGTGFGALVNSRVHYLQAIEMIRTSRWLEIGANLVFTIVFSIILSVPFKAYGIFAAFALSKLISLFVSYVISARKSGKNVPGIEDYLGLDETFLLKPQDVIAYPITTLQQCVLASKQVDLFCKGHHINSRIAFWASLCFEEITVNIISHGIKQSRRSPISEIRVTVSDNTLIMRIRDNGKAFNMNELAKMIALTKTPYENLGIRIICKEAAAISYFRIYGMNTTILQLKTQTEPSEHNALREGS